MRRGYALVLTLFVVLIVATVVFAAVHLATLDLRGAREDVLGARALYAARAGVSRARLELAGNYLWTGGAGPLADSSYSVVVEAGPGNATSADKVWRVTSTGACDGARRTVVAVVTLETFAKYAYFTDRESTPSSTEIWFFDRDEIRGPTHTNGFFRISGHPRYSAQVTSANTGDDLFDPSAFTYSQHGVQTDPARFYRTYSSYARDGPVALDGSEEFSFAGGQPRVPLPIDTGAIEAAAGARYEGDRRLLFRSSGTVEVQRRRGSGWVQEDVLSTTTDPGVVIHVDGELYVQGDVQGRVTVGATQDVHLTGDLRYVDPATDVLGLVGGEDIVVESDPWTRRDRYVQATLMALNGSFTVQDYASGAYRGSLRVFGGIVQLRRGPVGTFSGTQPVTGYSKDYRFDAKLLTRPPLWYPPTGRVQVRSLLDLGSPGAG